LDRIRKFIRLKDFITYLFLIVVVLVAVPSTRFLVVGSIFFCFGLLIQILAAGTMVRLGDFVTGGIYQMTRNPLYFGGFFAGLGLTLMSADPVMILIYMIISYWLLNTIINLEESFLADAFGRDFEEYKSKVPRLFPTTGAPPGLGVNFSFKRYFKNPELIGNIATVIIAVLLWMKFIYSIPSIFYTR
jgi:protein-S-isoprenylcysteine O-methyltransferase Ste14